MISKHQPFQITWALQMIEMRRWMKYCRLAYLKKHPFGVGQSHLISVNDIAIPNPNFQAILGRFPLLNHILKWGNRRRGCFCVFQFAQTWSMSTVDYIVSCKNRIATLKTTKILVVKGLFGGNGLGIYPEQKKAPSKIVLTCHDSHLMSQYINLKTQQGLKFDRCPIPSKNKQTPRPMQVTRSLAKKRNPSPSQILQGNWFDM